MRSDDRMNEHTDSVADTDKFATLKYIEQMIQGIAEKKWLLWRIEDKKSSNVVGTIIIWNFNDAKISGELGFGLTPKFQGKGFMSEAIDLVSTFSFEKL